MDIVIIGSGNAAAVLGRKFKGAGHNILQIFGRNASAASALAYEWNTESTNYMSAINKKGDMYLIAVPDDAIKDVIRDLKLPGKIVAHTAAAVPKEILKHVSPHFGVFYPLQSLRKDIDVLPDIPIFVDGSDDVTMKLLSELAHSIAKVQVVVADDEARLKLHLAAVIVSNFTNHLYTLAEQYCKKEGLDFKQLLPLIEETATRIRQISPQQAQTGPAIRHDGETIKKHLGLLEDHQPLKKIYELLTQSIEEK